MSPMDKSGAPWRFMNFIRNSVNASTSSSLIDRSLVLMSVITIATLRGAATGDAVESPDGEGDAAGDSISVALAEEFEVEFANPEEPDDPP